MIFVVANSNGELQWNRPMWRLRKRKQVIPVYILSKNEAFRITVAEAGADVYFVYQLTEKTIKNVLLNKQL